MCRWLAYSGSPILLEELLYKPENSLIVAYDGGGAGKGGTGTPVSPTYEPPFKFTGTLKKVTVEVK